MVLRGDMEHTKGFERVFHRYLIIDAMQDRLDVVLGTLFSSWCLYFENDMVQVQPTAT